MVYFAFVRWVGNMENYLHYPQFWPNRSSSFFCGVEYPLPWGAHTTMVGICLLKMGHLWLVDIQPTSCEACYHYVWWALMMFSSECMPMIDVWLVRAIERVVLYTDTCDFLWYDTIWYDMACLLTSFMCVCFYFFSLIITISMNVKCLN